MSVTLNEFGFTIVADDVTHLTKNNGRFHYFSLPNLSDYKIKLVNNRETRSDAVVSVDGEKIGTWRVPAFSSITIQRPANVNRKLVFVKEDTYTAKYAGVTRNDPNNGLVTVVFKPEAQNIACCFDVEPTIEFQSENGPIVEKRSRACPYETTTGYVRAPTYYNKWTYGYDDSITKPPVPDQFPLYLNSSGSNVQNSGIKSVDAGYATGATILGAGTDQNFSTSARIYKYDVDNITTLNARMIIKKVRPYVSLRNGMNTYVPEPTVTYDDPYYETVYPPVNNLTDRFYDSDRTLIEKPYHT